MYLSTKMIKRIFVVLSVATISILFKPQIAQAGLITTISIPSGYDNDERSYGTVYCDGVPCSTTRSGNTVSFEIPENSKLAIMYRYEQRGTVWGPTNMSVWDVSDVHEIMSEDGEDFVEETPDGETPEEPTPEGTTPEGTTPEGDTSGEITPEGETPEQTPTEETPSGEESSEEGGVPVVPDIEITEPVLVSEFTDLFMYKGFSIRIKGTGGIRAKTGIKRSARQALLSSTGLAGYKLIEYGQLAISKDKLENQNSGKLITTNSSVGKCYWKKSNGAVEDHYLSDSDDNHIIFANVLDITSDRFDSQVCFRAYAKLKKISDDSEVVIYGPIVSKSIYDVANARLSASDSTATEKEYVKKVKGTVEFKDETIVFLGDSIMRGDTLVSGVYTYGVHPLPTIITSKIKGRYNNTNILIANNADSGGTYSDPGCNSDHSVKHNINRIEAVDPKLIVILAGHNDWHFKNQHQGGIHTDPSYPHDSEDDCITNFGALDSNGLIKYHNGAVFNPLSEKYENTSNYNIYYDESFCSGVWTALETLTTKYPDAKIVVVTPPQTIPNRVWQYRGTYYENVSTHKNLTYYAETELKIANYFKNYLHKNVYSIDVYGVYPNQGWERGKETSSYFNQYFTSDGIHLTESGYNALGEYIYQKLISDVIE